jgi:serine/threonine protein kinase
VRRFNEKDSALIISDVITALVYLHDLNIIHRDLKLENILFKDHEHNTGIKLVDFGLATFTNRIDVFRHCGTPGYVAPEMLHDKEYGT